MPLMTIFTSTLKLAKSFSRTWSFLVQKIVLIFFFSFSLCQFIYARAIFKCEWVLHLVSQQLFFYRLAYECCLLLCTYVNDIFPKRIFSLTFTSIWFSCWKPIQQEIKISRFVQQYERYRIFSVYFLKLKLFCYFVTAILMKPLSYSLSISIITVRYCILIVRSQIYTTILEEKTKQRFRFATDMRKLWSNKWISEKRKLNSSPLCVNTWMHIAHSTHIRIHLFRCRYRCRYIYMKMNVQYASRWLAK